MDVEGMLKRMGFKQFPGEHRWNNSAWINNVPLFGGGCPARIGVRNISHMGISATLSDSWNNLSLRIRFGYPVSKPRKSKIILGFKEMLDGVSKHYSLTDDDYLLKFERLMTKVIGNFSTKRLSLYEAVDSEGGIALYKHVPCWEALPRALECALGDLSEPADPDRWFGLDPVKPVKRAERSTALLPATRRGLVTR
jgi:hypothetical protein